MSAFVDDLVGALQSEEDNTFIFDWLARCLQAEWTMSSITDERTWSPVRATHKFAVGTDTLGRRYLSYSADVFTSPSRPSALQLADSLNRRSPGGAFVVVKDGSSSLVRTSTMRLVTPALVCAGHFFFHSSSFDGNCGTHHCAA